MFPADAVSFIYMVRKMGSKVCIKTNCCAVQRNETYRIAEFFRQNGWHETENVEEADVTVITTCGVTEETENDSFNIVDSVIGKAKESAEIVVSGCLPNICVEKLKAKFFKAKFIPLDKLELFDALIEADVNISSVFYNAEPVFHHSSSDPRLDGHKYDSEYNAATQLGNMLDDKRFVEAYNYSTQGRYLWKDDSIFEIKVSSGCAQKCSYCASRLGIGNYRSKAIVDILREVDIAISKGYTNIMLMGDEIGAYGLDIGSSFIELVDSILTRNELIKIGIRYLHPTYLHVYFSELDRYFRRIFFICVSIQSASAKVLRDMNRDDNIQDIERDIIQIRSKFPDLYLHTQIIIGFPTETTEDFVETMTFLKHCRFDYIRYNIFSHREGTAAYQMNRCFDTEELNKRRLIMRDYCRANRKEVLYDKYVRLIEKSGKE